MASFSTANQTFVAKTGFLERLFALVALTLFFDIIIGLEASEGWTLSRGSEGNFTIRFVFLMVYLVTFFFLVLDYRRIVALVARNGLIVALLAITAISYFWSMDPPLTMRRAGALFGTTAFGLFLAHRFRLQEILDLVMSALALGAILSLFAAFIFPEFAIMDRELEGSWRGVFNHKNELGRTMALGATLFVVAAIQSRRFRLARCLIGTLCGALVFLSNSVTGAATLCSLLLGYAAAAVLRSRQLPVSLTATLLGLTALTIASVAIVEASALLGFFGRDLSLSGRVELWRSLWKYVEMRFWFGHGYGAFWESRSSPVADIRQSIDWAAANSHSGWLELWLDVGVVGLSIFLVAFVAALWTALKRLRVSHGIAAYGPVLILIYLFTTNLTESVILTQTLFPWALFVAVVVAQREEQPAPMHHARRLLPFVLRRQQRLPRRAALRRGADTSPN